MSNEELLRRVLGAETDKKSVHAGAILDVIDKAESKEEKVKLMSIALTERDSVAKLPLELENKDILDEKWDELNTTHQDFVQGHLKMAFYRSRNINEFSSEVLHMLDFLDERDEKIFVFAATLYSRYIPYRKLPGEPIKLTDYQINHYFKSDKDQFDLIRYIYKLPYTTVEEASLILQVIDSNKDIKLRAALLASYISKYIEVIKEKENE